eukprot:CAMPEP_0175593594 /NCGR_PEP_ID=MMETSP0096-20121207/54014_1 /TAXON_ID=311494 /ORGANISM="Alexandrium monilatum, Strain CCMP3105" /LENGTH=46 /DNA_ID= /DNA_START= /DNA_END= /DNA_ORIENTATION=
MAQGAGPGGRRAPVCWDSLGMQGPGDEELCGAGSKGAALGARVWDS